MFEAQHSKRPESDRGQTTPEQKAANPKPGRLHQTGDLTRIPVYAQAWGNLPPPWLRLPTAHQQAASPEQSLQRQVEEELQDDRVPQHMNEPLPIPLQKGLLPVQRVEAVPLPAYTQLAWGDQPPPWLRLPVQRRQPDEGNLLQGRDELTTQPKENMTGLPDTLKAGVENLSGLSLDNVHVHYNSSRPTEVDALAYTQGTEIHVGPGQEKHLAHEAWHVVQQKQGRVRQTLQAKGVAINDDEGLEREADVMGEKAKAKTHRDPEGSEEHSQGDLGDHHGEGNSQTSAFFSGPLIIQRTVGEDIQEGNTAIETAQGYQGEVLAAVNKYVGTIKQLEDMHDASVPVEEMATGYKVWSNNYYNKTQAYLYEAQRAAAHTNATGRGGRNSFAILGEDTDLNPDITIQTESFTQRSGVPVVSSRSRIAVEIKASTSAVYASLDKLVSEGIKQLKKREDTRQFNILKLEIHNDSQANHWPITDTDFANTYHGDMTRIPKDDWNTRLQVRMTNMKNTAGITLPLIVSASHKGSEYASVQI